MSVKRYLMFGFFMYCSFSLGQNVARLQGTSQSKVSTQLMSGQKRVSIPVREGERGAWYPRGGRGQWRAFKYKSHYIPYTRQEYGFKDRTGCVQQEYPVLATKMEGRVHPVAQYDEAAAIGHNVFNRGVRGDTCDESGTLLYCDVAGLCVTIGFLSLFCTFSPVEVVATLT